MSESSGLRVPAADTGTSAIDELLGGRQLLIVSNRQPYRHSVHGNEMSVDRPTGGLTSGLDPIMQETGGTWIAWGDGDLDSRVVDAHDCVAVPPGDPSYQLRRVWLTDAAVSEYYYGYCNQVLWPLCHGALTRVRSEVSSWRRYRQVNELFAKAVVEQAGRRPLIWFHDYHLGLAPAFVRSGLTERALLMHFWHIPWPSWDTYRASPHGGELLEGLLANDLLGFHVPRYQHNFLECVDAALPGATIDVAAGEVAYRGHVTCTAALPMGVPVDQISERVHGAEGTSFWHTFRRRYGISATTRIGLGVDRLDYTKGLLERLSALEHLWETYPGLLRSFTYVQNATKSRSRIPAYRAVQERVEAEVDRINRRFQTADWTPIIYVTHRLSRAELCSLYRHADVGIVSPIRDGLNLVAQEYVAAQVDRDGVLVLSDQAGIHDLLGEETVTITPTDTEGFTEAIAGALRFPPDVRKRRIGSLREWVKNHSLHAWLEANFRAAIAAESQ